MAVRYIVEKGRIKFLTQNRDGFYADVDGTIYALEHARTMNEIAKCGVAPFTLPSSHELTALCKVHDYMYSSPVYQAFYTRHQADIWLRDNIKSYPKYWYNKLLSEPFYITCKFFGKYRNLWENRKTR